MIQEHDYRLALRTGGTMVGTITAPDDGLPALEVASPPVFGGPEGTWSPEHLLVASVSACVMTTFQAIAANSKLETIDYADSSEGHMERDGTGLYRISSITLRPRVTIADPDRVDRAYRLLEKAKAACLISRSIQSEVRMESTVEVTSSVGSRASRQEVAVRSPRIGWVSDR